MSDNPPIDLRDLLSKPMSDFPDLPDLPSAKHFYGKILQMTSGHSTQKKTPFYQFDVRLTDPGEDVTPAELKKIADAGFSLSDYQVYAQLYLTPNTMRQLRRFVQSLGFPPNISFVENLKLDEGCNPTSETQDVVRGLDVLVKTQSMAENGRVYNNLDQIAGVAKK